MIKENKQKNIQFNHQNSPKIVVSYETCEQTFSLYMFISSQVYKFFNI